MNTESKKKNPVLRTLISIGKFIVDILLRVVLVIRDLGVAIWHGILGIIKFFKRAIKRFKDASLWTKIGHLIMGFGNFAHKQIVKGLIFLGIEVLFILYLVLSPTLNGVPAGGKAIGNFFTLGSDIGMPVSREVLKLSEQPIYTKGNRIDINDENYFAQKKASIRLVNIVETYGGPALDNFKVEENVKTNPNAVDENKKLIYGSYLTNIVIDDRYGTHDIYGFSREENITAGSVLQIANKTTAPILLESDKEIAEFPIAMQTSNGKALEDSACEINVYRIDLGDVVESDYVYLILAKGDANRGTTVDLVFGEEFVGTSLFTMEINTDYVNDAKENSFLMMLLGIISFAMVAVFLIIWNLSIASSYKADCDVREGRKPTTFKEDAKTLLDGRFHLALLSPAILLLLIFTIVPTILMILIAFTDMEDSAMITGQKLASWVGFSNFASLFAQNGTQISVEVGKNFGSVLSWTFIWALLATFSCYFGGIFLALLLNRKDVKAKKFWRTIFVLTIAIPQFITFLIFRNMMKDSGPINTLFNSHIDFLGTQIVPASFPWYSKEIMIPRITVLVINLYVGIPYTMLMTSGILMNIPADLYEAATIDGANKWQMFRKITLPYIIFVTTPYLISSFIGNITSFNTIFLTTGGGPTDGSSIAGRTDLLVTWLYKMTIDKGIYNAGSIIGILTFIITASLTLVCYRNSKAYKEEDTFQ